MYIQLYIYRVSDGLFLYEDTGSITGVLADVGEGLDFTLKPLPESESRNPYRWVDNKWVQDSDITTEGE